MITSDKIRNELEIIWPILANRKRGILMPLDRRFLEVDLFKIKELVERSRQRFEASLPKHEVTMDEVISGHRKQEEDEDCDDWALEAYAYVKRYYRKKEGLKYPAPFGRCIGNKFNGVEENHTMNIVYSNGIYLVEPQTGEVRKPGKGDSIWFVEM